MAAARQPGNPPPVHPRDRPGGLRNVRGHFGLLDEILCLDDAAGRSKRPACSARQRKRVQELAAERAAHYDGICLARWRRISVALRGRFCMPPEPRGTPHLSGMDHDSKQPLVSVIWPTGVVSHLILPEAALCDRTIMLSCVCQVLGYELSEILPKHLLQILGP